MERTAMRNSFATCSAAAVVAATLFAPVSAQAWGYRPYARSYAPHAYRYYRPYAYPAYAYRRHALTYGYRPGWPYASSFGYRPVN